MEPSPGPQGYAVRPSLVAGKKYYYTPILRTVEDILPLASTEKFFIHSPVWLGVSGINSHNLAYYYREKEERLGSIDLNMPLTVRLMNSGSISMVSTFLSWFEDSYGHRYYHYFLTSFGRIIFNTAFSGTSMVKDGQR